MVDVAEVVVRATPEGMGDVNRELDSMEGKMQDTKENVSGTAGALGGLASKVKGAMKATVAGLAIGAAGLASQVPVVGELVSGLGAIVNALAFKLDAKLRPALSKVTDSFFNIAAAISEGNYGQVRQEIAGLVKEFTGLNELTPESILRGLINAIGNGLSQITQAFTNFEQNITAGDFEDFFLRVGSFLKTGLVEVFKTARDDIDWSSLLVSIIRFIGKALVGLAGAFDTAVIDPIVGWFMELVGKAGDWGKALLQNFLSGIRGFAENVVQGIVNVINTIISGINTIIEGLPNEIKSKLDVETFSKLEAPDSGDMTALSEEFIGSVGSGVNKVFLDGAEVDNQQGRFRKDSLTRRGG